MNQRLNILASLGCVNSTRAVKAFMNIPKNPDYKHPPSGLSDIRFAIPSAPKKSFTCTSNIRCRARTLPFRLINPLV